MTYLAKVSSKIMVYADDVILYREIKPEDSLILQKDLSIIAH